VDIVVDGVGSVMGVNIHHQGKGKDKAKVKKIQKTME